MLRLVDTLTYWLETGRTGGGGTLWAAGVTVPARIANRTEQINRPDGQIELSRKAFYTEAELPVGSRVAEGDFSGDIAPPANGAFRIARNSRADSMNTVKMALGV
jgi:hypothetical protein